MKISTLHEYNFKPAFKSYNKIDKNTGNSISTNFYHDTEVLQKAVDIIEKEFPHGTDILIYAGSNGEEALSVNTLLHNRKKYKIYSLDISKEAVNFANRGVYGIHPLAEDGFLLNDNKEGNKKYLSDIFHKNFIETIKPKNFINVSDFIYSIKFGDIDLYPQRYFAPAQSLRQNIKFADADISNIENFNNNKKAGAVFFRNAIYQLTKNDLTGVLKYGYRPDLETNKRQVINELIKKIYNKLEVNGIFVLGSHLQEHLYIADNSVPDCETILGDKSRNIRFMTKHPVVETLKKNSHFIPIYESVIEGLNTDNVLKIPLIWQKIK